MDTGVQDVSGYDNPPKRDTLIESRLAEGSSLSGEQTKDLRAPMSPKDRVRQHRAQLHEQRRRRLEVCISTPLIEQMSRIARGYRVPLWAAIQKALEVYVEDYRELAAESRRLNDEGTRLRGQADSPEWRRQAEEYNRKLAGYRGRCARFQRSVRREYR